MNKLLLAAVVGGFALSAQAQVIYNNGPVVDGNGLSIIANGGTLFGAGAQTSAGNSVADNFTVAANTSWNVTSLVFYGYQTSATAFPFTAATWSIVSGDVNTGTVVASGTTSLTNGGQVGFRVTPTTLTDTARRIFAGNADVTDFSLGAGSYWLRWNLAGNAALSGPWQPPTSDGAIGDAQQALTAGSFAALVDAGNGLGLELPFTINGSVVPEAGTLGMMLAGGLVVGGLVRRRRA